MVTTTRACTVSRFQFPLTVLLFIQFVHLSGRVEELWGLRQPLAVYLLASNRRTDEHVCQ